MSDPGYRDVTCSFCDRHNRTVHIVAGRDGLTICQVCVAAAAEMIDADAGVPAPEGGWSGRWAAKTGSVG
jgi:ClpX C4-type zinc finger